MKFSAQEEYGLRCLIRIAKFYHIDKALTISEISQAEGISQHNVAKLVRILRLGDFLESERGQAGGYTLTRAPEKIKIGDVLTTLGGRLYDESFCDHYSGIPDICTNSIDCSVRSLWRTIQDAVDQVVDKLTLRDLMVSEDSLLTKLESEFNVYNNSESQN